jgi:formylglycine-generating enzyme required for sulfatase activity
MFTTRLAFSVFCVSVLLATLVLPRIGQPAEKGYTNSIGMAFVRIPAGAFMMGSANDDPDARDFENPQHRVTISKPFYFGTYELTQAQWEAVMGSNPYTLPRSNPFYHLPGTAERITRPNHPATVSWSDAQAFIARLNDMEGGNYYRLPTEAEWEYAARAGTTTAYSFGNDDGELGRYAWYAAAAGTRPLPAGDRLFAVTTIRTTAVSALDFG